MARYHRRDNIVEAEQFYPERRPWPAGVHDWFNGKGWYIQTLEGLADVRPSDWIITGVAGEKYPCRDDIFQATYEALEPALRASDARVDGPEPDEPVEHADDLAAAVGTLAAEVRALREKLDEMMSPGRARPWAMFDTNDSIHLNRYPVTVSGGYEGPASSDAANVAQAVLDELRSFG